MLTIKARDLEDQIRKGYKNDIMAQNILTKEPISDHFAITPNGLIEYKSLIYVFSKYV